MAARAGEAWRRARCAVPATLADLRPAYIKTIPKDIFTDKPLIYTPRAKGYLLYSVGENRKDDGGARDEPADDLAVRVP